MRGRRRASPWRLWCRQIDRTLVAGLDANHACHHDYTDCARPEFDSATSKGHVGQPANQEPLAGAHDRIHRPGTRHIPHFDGVYWLSQPGALSNNGAPVTIYEDSPISGQVTKGPSFTGFIGSPALTDTAGWVWIVVGVGDNVVVKQLDPSTLAIHASESLPVNDGAAPQVNATLTATVDGPLWMAGGEDLWALNPSNGAVEAEIDTGNWIGSMSTDPAGSLLYVDGQTSATGGIAVTEYDAQTGKELLRVEKPLYLVLAVGTGSIAATKSGVWVSVRYGMAGGHSNCLPTVWR